MKLVEQRVIDFVAATASKEPTPGGGAIAALTAATGAALAEMVANLTFGKKGYEAVQTEIQQAYKDAAMVPFEIGELANQIFDLAELASRKGNQNLITDGIIAAINARAAVKSAFLNVRINLSGIKDESFVAELISKMHAIEKDLDDKESAIIGLYK